MRSSEPISRRTDRRRCGFAPGSWCALLLVAALLPVAAVAEAPDSTAAPRDSSVAFERLEVEGATLLGAREIQSTLGLPFPADSLQARLRRLGRRYYDLGRLDTRFRTDPAPPGLLRLYVEEGPPAHLSQVYLRGSQTLPEPIVREILDLAPGREFRPPQVETRLAALMDAYARRGYLDAEATIERLELLPEGVVLGIAIAEGERATLEEVTVSGNTATRTELVERLAGLRPPQAADAVRIREAPQLLRRSGLFADAGEPVLYRLSGGDRVGVVLRVVESERRNTAFGALGLARDPARDQPYVTGSIDLALRNIYGTGRDLSVAWRRDARLGSRLAVGYRERYVLGSPLDLGLALSQTVRDSTSTWQTLDLATSVRLQRNVALDVGGALDRTVFHLVTPGNALRLRVRIGLRFATLLREEDSARFGTFEVIGEYARRRNDFVVGGTPDRTRVGQTLWGGRFEAGFPLAIRHIVAARGEWHFIESDVLPVPDSELYEFGGAQTLRGFREAQFRGDRVVFGGIEYRYGNPRAARVYAFVDAGAFSRRGEAGWKDKDAMLGTGVGLRAAVATGTLDLAFALGDEERSFGAVKLHVSLLQRF